jgi:hypothetical protein
MEKLFQSHQVFLCITGEEVDQDQTILMMQYLENEHPNVLVKERSILGCTLIEEMMASEIPFITFNTEGYPLASIKRKLGKHPLFKTFQKIILICSKNTFETHLTREFKVFEYDDTEVQIGSVYITKKEKGLIKFEEVPRQATS